MSGRLICLRLLAVFTHEPPAIMIKRLSLPQCHAARFLYLMVSAGIDPELENVDYFMELLFICIRAHFDQIKKRKPDHEKGRKNDNNSIFIERSIVKLSLHVRH